VICSCTDKVCNVHKRTVFDSAACKQVTMPTDDVVPEGVLTAAGEDAAVVLDLWRADMLLGVAEVVEGCTLVRVEPSVGLLLGVCSSRMLHSTLNQ
jgi:hypothetical protein